MAGVFYGLFVFTLWARQSADPLCNSSSTLSAASSHNEIFTTIFHRLVGQALSLPRRVDGWMVGRMSQGIFRFTILYNLHVLVVVVLNLAVECL